MTIYYQLSPGRHGARAYHSFFSSAFFSNPFFKEKRRVLIVPPISRVKCTKMNFSGLYIHTENESDVTYCRERNARRAFVDSKGFVTRTRLTRHCRLATY